MFDPQNTTEFHARTAVLEMTDGSRSLYMTMTGHISQGEKPFAEWIESSTVALGAPDAYMQSTRDGGIVCVTPDGWVHRHHQLKGGVPSTLEPHASVETGDDTGGYRYTFNHPDRIG